MAKKLQKSPDFSDFFNNLIDICNSRNTTPTALAERYASRSVLTAWKNGTINANIVPKLAFDLDVSINDFFIKGKEKSPSAEQSEKEQVLSKEEKELLGYFSVLPRDVRQKLLGRAELLAEQASEQPEEQQEPIVLLRHSLYMVSAGTGFDLDEGDSWDEIPVPDTPEARKADFCITVSGNSMEPKFFNEDVVLVKQTSSIDEGEIGIFRIGQKGYIKKYGGDRLISLNPNYSDILFSDYDFEDISCCGLVLGIA